LHGVHAFLSAMPHWIEAAIGAWGYGGVVVLMALESCNIPIPSEVILTFAGILVQKGVFNFHLAALAGALGCVIGSAPSYALGYYGGRPFLEKYGKWLLLAPADLQTAERWVARYGNWAFFISRLLPVVRTFISLPAGILKARFKPFLFYTFIGSWIWSYALVWAGIQFFRNRALFSAYWHRFDMLIVTLCLILGILYLVKRIRHVRTQNNL
jgi:membrane protein DedA with SNARE-associated domain